MKKRVFITAILLALFLLSKHLYFLNHTEVEFEVLNEKKNCSPELLVKVRKAGVENVITSAVISKEPFFANMISGKLAGEILLGSMCTNSTEAFWTLTLYAKQTLFRIPKIELVNETLK